MVDGPRGGGRARSALVMLVLTAFGTLAGWAPSAASDEAGATPAAHGGVIVHEYDCDGVAALIKVPVQTVRPLVPAEFTLATDQERDFAKLWITPVRCAGMTVGDTTEQQKPKPTVYVSVRVEICDPEDDPSGLVDACAPNEADGTHVELGHLHQFWFASNNEDLVAAFRKQGGVAADAAIHVEDLVFELTHELTHENFYFAAPAPAPSPFTMEARVAPPSVALGNLISEYWAAVPEGRMRVSSRIDLLQVGHVEWGAITPRRGSDMQRIFCAASVDGRFRSPQSPGGPEHLVLDEYSWVRISSPHARFTVSADPKPMSPVHPTPACTLPS